MSKRFRIEIDLETQAFATAEDIRKWMESRTEGLGLWLSKPKVVVVQTHPEQTL